MAKKTDKRTSNLIIAGGYCLVAVIILLNYLGETSRARSFSSNASESMFNGASQDKNINYLKKQLEEEKKVNSEMRSLLRQIQKTGTDKRAIPLPVRSLNAAFVAINEPLPELNLELLKRATTYRPNPFIPGKNPYAPNSKREDSNKVISTSFPFRESLKCDSRLPFLISGANTQADFLGN